MKRFHASQKPGSLRKVSHFLGFRLIMATKKPMPIRMAMWRRPPLPLLPSKAMPSPSCLW